MTSPKIDKILSIFETENRVLIRFMRLCKQHENMPKDFVSVLNMIEVSINWNLMQTGSLGKFIFKDA